MTNQKFLEDEENYCTECNKLLKKGRAVWLELVQETGDYYFHGIPKEILKKGHTSQGWYAFGSDCAKKIRID